MVSPAPSAPACVLDTNVVLDFWVFEPPQSAALRGQVTQGHVRWLATAAMRDELARVLDYPHLARRLTAAGRTSADVLAQFDRHAQLLHDAPTAPYRCKDPDDQKFIDLAVHCHAALFSKDAQVLCMKTRLARLGIAINPPLLTGYLAPFFPENHTPHEHLDLRPLRPDRPPQRR